MSNSDWEHCGSNDSKVFSQLENEISRQIGKQLTQEERKTLLSIAYGIVVELLTYTSMSIEKAAKRAVKRAIRKSKLPLVDNEQKHQYIALSIMFVMVMAIFVWFIGLVYQEFFS